MKYLVELIKKENPEASIEYAITYLIKNGHMSYTVQYHYDIYDFYKKCLDHYKGLGLPNKAAIQDTCKHFSITEQWLYKLIKKFKQSSLV